MRRLYRRLWRILLLGWLGFALAGAGLYTFATPRPVLLVDRSYCPPAQWQQLVKQYDEVYQRAQRRQIRLQTVVLFSSLGEERRTLPLTPIELQNISTYGRPDPQRQAHLESQYPGSLVLSCGRSLL